MTNTKDLRAEVRAAAKHCASWHACATGDCPHENYLDCFDAAYLEGATSPDSPLLKFALQELERAHLRMGILVDRMRGCNEVTGQHGLIDESEAYVVETLIGIKEIRECMESK